MRKLFKSLVPILLVVSMIFSLGIESISINNPVPEDSAEQQKVKDPPKVEEPKVEGPKAEEPKTEDPKAEDPKAEKPKAEDPKAEDPKAEKPKAEDPKAEEPKIEKPKAEDPKAEEPKIEKPKAEDPKAEEHKIEKPKAEDPKAEEHKVQLDPLDIVLTNATTLIEDAIVLGSATDPNEENYMSEATGGDGIYSYEWRVLGEETPFSQERNPRVHPIETTIYQLTLRDSNGAELKASMLLTVLDPRGSITITNTVNKLKSNDANRKFDIFVDGPNGSLYTVSLIAGESITLNNLKRGSYKISTIVPMNYRLENIRNEHVSITVDSLDQDTTITYKRTNNSWFYSK